MDKKNCLLQLCNLCCLSSVNTGIFGFNCLSTALQSCLQDQMAPCRQLCLGNKLLLCKIHQDFRVEIFSRLTYKKNSLFINVFFCVFLKSAFTIVTIISYITEKLSLLICHGSSIVLFVSNWAKTGAIDRIEEKLVYTIFQ